MRVVIAGSRDLNDEALVNDAIANSKFTITTVISGKCPTGADAFGEAYAAKHGIPIEPYPADWAKHGKAAGPLRNRAMAEACDAAIVVLWETGSRGSESMIECMKIHPAKPCFVVRVKRE